MRFAQGKGATFPILGKINCEKGDDTDPFYNFLKSSLTADPAQQSLGWNFAKFLCDSQGVPVKRYSPRQSPLSFENDIRDILNAQADL